MKNIRNSFKCPKTRKILALLLVPVVVGGLVHIKRKGNVKEVYAVDPLIVTYAGGPPPSPMFYVTGMLPGDEEEKVFNVLNDSVETEAVTMEGVKTEELKDFADILDIEITDLSTSTVIFTGKLQDFFNQLPFSIGVFPAGVDKDFRVKVKFPSEAGNPYQEAKVVFDIMWHTAAPPIDLPPECSHLQGIITNVIEGTEEEDDIWGTPESDLILGYGGEDEIDGKSGHDCIVGGNADDELDGGNGNDVILGGAGEDKIDAGDENDLIYGGTGNDDINGGDNNDVIYGNEGDDEIDGGHGEDRIEGGIGDDEIDGGNGPDYIDGGEGNDDIKGGHGNDVILGGPGNDEIDGGSEDDFIDGGPGNDEIDGGAGVDNLFGNTGNDDISGSSGDDFLDGGGDTDNLDGDAGDDTCINGEIYNDCEFP
jgi:hypothetical protein